MAITGPSASTMIRDETGDTGENDPASRLRLRTTKTGAKENRPAGDFNERAEIGKQKSARAVAAGASDRLPREDGRGYYTMIGRFSLCAELFFFFLSLPAVRSRLVIRFRIA